jgi:hypothetical protein
MPQAVPQAILGIDLGTTNCAVAVAAAGGGARIMDVRQLEAPGRVGVHALLPSCVYVPHAGEVREADVRLPWQAEGDVRGVVGAYAKQRGAEVPERVVQSAKSWLGHAGADRRGAILPWGSPLPAGEKWSPVQASAAYLAHLLAAYRHEVGDATALPAVTLTVPASFDEVARELTLEAARAAGLGEPTLLEEPLAAFYAFLERATAEHGGLRVSGGGPAATAPVAPGDLVLVCDVGGGTTDLSLVAVGEANGEVTLTRVAVGEHLLLGGDNMDLALAYALKADLEAQGRAIDAWQLQALVAAARGAKERLLAEPDLAALPVAVTGRGGLFASVLSTELTRARVEETLVAGFFPAATASEGLKARRASGLRAAGLPYESDPAITRHLVRFLAKARENVASSAELSALVADRLAADATLLTPTAVLFNGGVFKAAPLRARVLETLAGLGGGAAPRELGADYDLAVARGAAYFGRLKQTGEGVRVKSGIARSYYLGLETPMAAVPGVTPPLDGLCVVAQGTDEGSAYSLEAHEFGLVVGEPVEFRFFSTTSRAGDAVGDVVRRPEDALTESSRLTVTLPRAGRREGELVPVKLDAEVTDVGTLRLAFRHPPSGETWRLEVDVRGHDA